MLQFPFLRPAFALLLIISAAAIAPPPAAAQSTLSRSQLESIGRRIWESEAAGKVEGLTAWNSGENFASLGIGHFIWYPAGQRGPFEESFPPLMQYFQQSGVQIPAWLAAAKDCPWPNREAFLHDKDGERQRQLRALLSSNIALQTQFIINRLQAATPKMQAAAGAQGAKVARNMQLLSQTAAGNYAMIDYVNFKGEGLKPEERYNGQGWGLLQVLMEMDTPASAAAAPRAFADAAKTVLRRRVENSPAARKERQWLAGWLNRCEAYAR